MLVGIAGFATSGKTSAANILVEELGFTKISFADPLKAAALALDPLIYTEVNYWDHEEYAWRLSEIIKNMGWDLAKRHYPEVRRTLQRLGTEVGRNLFGEYFWVDQLAETYPDITSTYTRYVVDDVRFETESNFVQMKLGDLIWIDRPGLTAGDHASESGHPKQHAELIIDNSGTIEDLRAKVRDFAYVAGYSLS